MMMSGRNRYPFTPTQWEELEHQALIFKYMVSGIPIPSELISTIKRSFLEEESSFSSRLFSYQPQHVGWNCFKERKMDPEAGRCRRTDGKKWRCSKQAYIDSKYCERHMHRGKNRSRKPVEHSATTMVNTSTATQNLSSSNNQKDHHGIGYIELSLQAHPTDPHRNFSVSSMEDSWQFTPLPASSSSSNHRTNTTHRFFDEWPPKHRHSSSWLDLEQEKSNKPVKKKQKFDHTELDSSESQFFRVLGLKGLGGHMDCLFSILVHVGLPLLF